MSKKARNRHKKLNVDFDDDYESYYDDDFDLENLPRNIHGTEWDEDREPDARYGARRNIERRRDMKRMHSELDDWEVFGAGADW